MINIEKLKESLTDEEELIYHSHGIKAVLDHREHRESWWRFSLKKYTLRFLISEILKYAFLLTFLYVLKIKV